MLTPCIFNCYIFLEIAGSLAYIWFPESLIVLRYLPICALFRSFKNILFIRLLLRSKVFTKDFEIKLITFFPSRFVNYRFLASTSLIWVYILFKLFMFVNVKWVFGFDRIVVFKSEGLVVFWAACFYIFYIAGMFGLYVDISIYDLSFWLKLTEKLILFSVGNYSSIFYSFSSKAYNPLVKSS